MSRSSRSAPQPNATTNERPPPPLLGTLAMGQRSREPGVHDRGVRAQDHRSNTGAIQQRFEGLRCPHPRPSSFNHDTPHHTSFRVLALRAPLIDFFARMDSEMGTAEA
jgi:hypothetical protein